MNLITDRTQADVMLGTAKGRYGIDDLNRVEAAVGELCALAAAMDIRLDRIIKTDWQLSELFSVQTWPVQSQMMRYLENVRALCEAVAVSAELPVSMECLTWDGANQIERALLQTQQQIQNVLQIFRYSGEVFAGEENGI